MKNDPPSLESLDVVALWSLFVSFERRLSEELRPLGLTVSTFRLMGGVAQSPDGVRQSELAQRVGITPPSVSAAVGRLEARGLVHRIKDPTDPRARRVRVANVAALGPGIDVLGRMEQLLFGDLTHAERAHARALLHSLTTRLEGP